MFWYRTHDLHHHSRIPTPVAPQPHATQGYFTCFFVVVTICDVSVSITDMIAKETKNRNLEFIHKFTFYVTVVCLVL